MNAADHASVSPPPRRDARRLLSAALPGVPFVLAALAMVAVLRSTAPQTPALALSAWGGRPGAARPLPDGATVRAGASLYLELELGTPCPLWVVAVDAAGRVQRIHPIVAAPESHGALDIQVQASPAPGPQRFFAVCAPDDGLDYARVLAAAGAVAREGASGLRTARALAGLPEGTRQASILVEAM
ncbi:conserved hypothetical protein [Anaeromyxobacter dehalogenans 2CP-1]|uniref:DUF4384 domain-containing protein n=1 Tax=Anaeromyxobacter dehalogenans (strain ATCC BAA-258 / DSM 21875 / 2CP-1) TaxID=455488 RepID=B8JCK4_ANAD2|nr:hypothetical protein [Anaeromyxobacter dehalogenans]ACL67724.1 conserved hypothetical protein [Anaeromyxobacter dehalogenans 2CP-1]